MFSLKALEKVTKESKRLYEESRTIYGLKQSGNYDELERMAVEAFARGRISKGEKCLAALYSSSRPHFERAARKIAKMGYVYPVFEMEEVLLK